MTFKSKHSHSIDRKELLPLFYDYVSFNIKCNKTTIIKIFYRLGYQKSYILF